VLAGVFPEPCSHPTTKTQFPKLKQSKIFSDRRAPALGVNRQDVPCPYCHIIPLPWLELYYNLHAAPGQGCCLTGSAFSPDHCQRKLAIIRLLFTSCQRILLSAASACLPAPPLPFAAGPVLRGYLCCTQSTCLPINITLPRGLAAALPHVNVNASPEDAPAVVGLSVPVVLGLGYLRTHILYWVTYVETHRNLNDTSAVRQMPVALKSVHPRLHALHAPGTCALLPTLSRALAGQKGPTPNSLGCAAASSRLLGSAPPCNTSVRLFLTFFWFAIVSSFHSAPVVPLPGLGVVPASCLLLLFALMECSHRYQLHMSTVQG
jgi:hypothetical protein